MTTKKGVSAVVATALLLILTLALAVIIATVAIPFARNSLKSSTECSDYKTYYTFDPSFRLNCYETGGATVKVSIRAAQISEDAAKKVKGFQLVFTGEGSSESALVVNGAPGSCAVGGVVNYDVLCPDSNTLAIPSIGESRSYRYFSKSRSEGYVLVNPLLVSGRTCDTSDKIKLFQCAS